MGQVRRLPDGSTLELRQVVCTAKSFNYSHQTGGKFLRLAAPVLRVVAPGRFNVSSGSFGFGGDGNTNLIAITVARVGASAGGSYMGRLRVFDEQGNLYDARWGASTLGMQGETVHGWQIRAFPRRCRTIGLRFLGTNPDGSWTNVADFHILNPLYAKYPQWTPEPWPATKADGNLAVTLRKFQSGGRMSGRHGQGDASVAGRKTRVVFEFAEDGKAADDWRVQKLTISDATGNRWAPYLDFIRQNFDWATNGTVEFFGALWPGEQAWRLELEAVRTGGFKPEELWEASLPLPPAGTVVNVTNRWEHDGQSVALISLAGPNGEHAGTLKWIAKWWGDDRNQVYSLGLSLEPALAGRRLSVVRMVDQDGGAVKLMEGRAQDAGLQAVFFKPAADASKVRITFALLRSRFVQFLARPEFVKDGGGEGPAGAGGRKE